MDEIRKVLAQNELEVARNTQGKKKKSYKYTRRNECVLYVPQKESTWRGLESSLTF